MKVCIYGAGAIGGWIGVKLAQVGCDVSVVARGATVRDAQQRAYAAVDAIRWDGVQYRRDIGYRAIAREE